MDAGLLVAAGGLLIGGVAAGLYASLAIDRHARRLDEHDRRIGRLQDVVLREGAKLAVVEETVRGLCLASTESVNLALGGAAMACTDVSACDRPEACDDGCRRVADPGAATIPIGFEHPDDSDKAEG